MFNIFLYIFGIILTVIGIISTILYFNLIPIGYSFSEYVNFIISRVECLCLIFGIVLLFVSIFIRRKK